MKKGNRIKKSRARRRRRWGVIGYAKKLLRKVVRGTPPPPLRPPRVRFSPEEWHSAELPQLLLTHWAERNDTNTSCVRVPKFALERPAPIQLDHGTTPPIFFMVDISGASAEIVASTVTALECHGVGTTVFYTWDPVNGLLGEVKTRNGIEPLDALDITSNAILYLLRPGEEVLQRSIIEHVSCEPEEWDLVFGPFYTPRGRIKWDYSGTQPAAIRGHVWHALIDLVSDTSMDMLEKREKIINEFAARRLSSYFCPIPCIKERSIRKERAPGVMWFLQEHAIRSYVQGAKLSNCYRTPPARLLALEKRRAAIASFRAIGLKRVKVVSERISKIFSEGMRDEVRTYFRRERGIEATFLTPDEVTHLDPGEILILLVHQCFEEKTLLERIIAQQTRGVIITWFWDNHHLAPLNLETAILSDAICAGHSFISDYLEVDGVMILPPVPLCVTQWTCSESRRFFRCFQTREKNIVGGFVEYEKACERNRLVSRIQEALPEGKVELFPYKKGKGYFSLSTKERFLNWKGYMASLCVPLFFDLSQRYFDSLLTGQIPLVVGRIPDLETLLGAEGPEKDWTVYQPHTKDFDQSDVPALVEATFHRYEAFGEAGSQNRHEHTVSNHMFVHRLETIVSHWMEIGANTSLKPSRVSRDCTHGGHAGRKTVINVQHGLGNRMRAYASARVLADMRGGEFQLYWKPDHHCEATFDELFENEEKVIDNLPAHDEDPSSNFYNLVDLEQTANENEFIDLDSSSQILIKSQRCLRFSTNRRAEENEVLRMLRPSRAVLAKMQGIPDLSQCVGIHVRMEGGAETSDASYDKPEQWDEKGREAMFHWRAQSHWIRFLGEMKRLVECEPGLRFFLASDQDFVISKMHEEFGDRIISIERSHFDRSSEQIIEGLADILLLSRCRSILASNWSSFSEMAIRIGGKEAKYAGIDF